MSLGDCRQDGHALVGIMIGTTCLPEDEAEAVLAAAEPFLRQLVVTEIVTALRQFKREDDSEDWGEAADFVDREFGGGPDEY